MTLEEMEAIAKAAQERNPGPWSKFNYGKPAETSFDYIVDSSPRPDWMDDPDEAWIGQRVITTDGNYYGPHGPTATHIATFSPDVVLKLLRAARAAQEWRRRADAYDVRGQGELIAALDALGKP